MALRLAVPVAGPVGKLAKRLKVKREREERRTRVEIPAIGSFREFLETQGKIKINGGRDAGL